MPYIIAVDTETEEGRPWSVQLSTKPREARFIYASDGKNIAWLKKRLERDDVLTVVHNALFDVAILNELDIYPTHVADTMVMAYLLGLESKGLKNLAYRYCGLEMSSYWSMVKDAAAIKAKLYLQDVLDREWPDPEPVEETKPDGTPHVRKPQNITTKVKKLLKKTDIDYREKWKAMDGTEQVEAILGPIPTAWLSDIPEQDAIHYACMDADATFRLYRALWPQIEQEGLERVFWLDMGITQMVVDMMRTGIRIDVEKLRGLKTEFYKELEDIESEIAHRVGSYINPASPKQVQEMLKSLGIHTKSTSSQTLDRYADHYPEVALVREYRKFGKLIGTYTDALVEKVDESSRLHTSYSVTRTLTGRLASSNPNLQNIPARSSEGKRIRGCFVATPGYKLVAVDYSQIELRVAAHVSQDQTMLDVYTTGGDIHMTTACAMFDLPPEKIDDSKHRKPAKTVNFGTIYEAKGPTIHTAMIHAGVTGFTVDDCWDFIRAFLRRYDGYALWVEQTKAEAKRNGQVRDMFGRLKWVPEVYSVHERVKEAGLRAAVNFPIQAGAGGILKKAMIDLTPLYQDNMDVIRPLLQVHDELIWEIREDYLDTFIPLIVETMESAIDLSIPTPVDVEIGENWQDMQ